MVLNPNKLGIIPHFGLALERYGSLCDSLFVVVPPIRLADSNKMFGPNPKVFSSTGENSREDLHIDGTQLLSHQEILFARITKLPLASGANVMVAYGFGTGGL